MNNMFYKNMRPSIKMAGQAVEEMLWQREGEMDQSTQFPTDNVIALSKIVWLLERTLLQRLNLPTACEMSDLRGQYSEKYNKKIPWFMF